MYRFRRDMKVRFGDVDYAGIIFYPRYFEALNKTVEDWFAEEVGQSFKHTHDAYGIATPLVSVETAFLKPCRLDEILTYTLTIERLGPSAITLNVETSCGDQPRMRSTLTHVCVRPDISGAQEWPAMLLSALEKFTEAKSS